MGCVTAQKASDLATEHNFDINPITTVPIPDECPEIFQFHAVSDKDVESVIRGFASNKAPGYDKVSVRVLKDSLPAILPAITTIMNNSFNTKTFARSWKIAEVTPVLKSGDYEEPCNHDILLQKLHELGISSPSLDWFHSYLTDRYQRVRIHDSVSDPLPLKCGVPQGSILGPVLFTIYVNDLLSVPEHCKSACYVDDSKLYLSFPSPNKILPLPI